MTRVSSGPAASYVYRVRLRPDAQVALERFAQELETPVAAVMRMAIISYLRRAGFKGLQDDD